MKISLLTWLSLMILCGNHVTSGEDFNLSKPSMQEQFQGVNGNMTLNGLRNGGVESKEKPEIFHLIKTGHRGKGSSGSGSADINHKAPASAEKSDAPVSARPSILVSICTALNVTLALALIFPLPITF